MSENSILDELEMETRQRAAPESPPVTAQDALLEDKPHDLQIKILRTVSQRQLDQNDPILEAYNCTAMAAEAANAAGAAAQQVHADIKSIPDKILSGAVQAGEEIKGVLGREIEDKGIEIGRALVETVSAAADGAGGAIKQATSALNIAAGQFKEDLESTKDKAARDGIELFERLAIKAVSRGVSKSRIEWMIYGTIAAAFLLTGGAGSGFWYMVSTHHYTANAIQQINGKSDCNWINFNGQKQFVCVMDVEPTAK